MMKRIRYILMLAFCFVAMSTVALGQLMQEVFNYTPGQLTSLNAGANVSNGNWVSFSGTGNPFLVSSGALTYSGYTPSGLGGKVSMVASTASAEDAYRQFPAQGNGTTTYASMLINVTDIVDLGLNSSGGTYFATFLPSNSTSNFVGRTVIRQGSTAATVNFGVYAVSGQSPAWFSTDFAVGTTHLLVFSYQMVSGANNDTVSLWVNPSLTGTPAPDVKQAASGTEQGDIARLALRQANTSSVAPMTPNASIGGIRVSSSWAGVRSGLVDDVKFRVNMAVKWAETKFNPTAGDTVRVVGSFNGWSATDTTVRMTRNSANDSIWVLNRALDSSAVKDDTVYYKFFRTARGGDWENVSNRVHAIINGAHETPLYFFDNDSAVSPLVSVNFRVNMSIKMRELTFQPANGDTVRVVGGFQSWNTKDTSARMSKGATDSIYSRSFILNEGDQFGYKFFKAARGGLDWESGSDRSFTVPVGGGNIPAVMVGNKEDYFDRDSVFNATVIANILWQTDISPFVTLGWFDPTKDTVEVRGGFTGWSGQKTTPNPLVTNIWEYTTTSIIVPIGDQMPYKFYMRLDSANAVNKFPGIIWGGSSDNRDGFLYEHPAERGDGNSIHTVVNSTSQGPQRSYFSGIHNFGLLGATDSTTVTLKVNMGPATRYSNPFVLGTDTLWLVWQDALWRSAQVKLQGASFTQTMKMTRQSATDSVFTVSFKVKGKTHYNMQYTYRYKKSDASVVDQGGGLGGQNPYITRFIRRTAGVWPATYTATTDDWKKDAPLVGETATYPTDVEESMTPPGTFELSQNYPNPFNPTTNIRYTIPQQTTVRLRVFNLLGQQLVELVNEVKPAGTHVVGFDASRLSTGVYFYRIEAGSFTDVKKMVLLK